MRWQMMVWMVFLEVVFTVVCHRLGRFLQVGVATGDTQKIVSFGGWWCSLETVPRSYRAPPSRTYSPADRTS